MVAITTPWSLRKNTSLNAEQKALNSLNTHKCRFKQQFGLAEGPLVKNIESVLDLYSVRCQGTGVLELAESRAACSAPHSGTMC
jgi:hypothetical protein